MNDEAAALHRSLRWLQAALAALVLAFGMAALDAFRPSDDGQVVIRTRGVVIVDAGGRERILLGTPAPEAGSRIRTQRAERFERSGYGLPRVDPAYRFSLGPDAGGRRAISLVVDDATANRGIVTRPPGAGVSPASPIENASRTLTLRRVVLNPRWDRYVGQKRE
jgi:hypothetical protein